VTPLDNGPVLAAGTSPVPAQRRRTRFGVVFASAAVVLASGALLLGLVDGFARPVVAAALAVALVGANLAPVVAFSGGRIEALTPVGALLVPIGVLLPLPEAIVTYALGETLGVVLAHRFDSHVGGPAEDRVVRTGFVVGKSIVGATVGLVAMGLVTGPEPDVPALLLAAVVGVGVSTAVDHTVLAIVTSLVRRVSLVPEVVRGSGRLVAVASGEVVVGALVTVLAVREPQSLVLGLAVLALLALVGAAYGRAHIEREQTRQLLALAGHLQEATSTADVEAALLAALERLLPEDPFRIQPQPPHDDQQGWRLAGQGAPRWLCTPRFVDTRDYEQQPHRLVSAAIALSQVALTRAAAQERLVQQDELRSLVLATVAHDLRAPLATAATAMATLAADIDAQDPAIRDELIAVARRGVDRVGRLMDDLLDLELLDSATRGPGHAVVDEVISTLLLELDVERVVVGYEGCGGVVALDPVSLGRIVENLVVNAVKYSPEAGSVTIRCTSEEDRGGTVPASGVRIAVQDQGPGVAVEHRHDIFEPFEQVGHARGGSGLGLYVARRFVETCGGRIWVDDAPGGGAAFHVWLPSPVSIGPAGRPLTGAPAGG